MAKMTSEEIYEILKNRIVTLEYEPGHILNEIDLAKEFNVSRTPIRTIFKKLESADLLKIVPRYGVQVTQIDFLKMKSLFELTRILDPYAVRLAVTRISKEDIEELKTIINRLNSYEDIDDYQKAIRDDELFHKIITKSAKNVWLSEELERLHMHSERLWHYCDSYFDDMKIFTRTFNLIVQAIEDGDEDKAEEYAREHIDDFVEKIKGEML